MFVVVEWNQASHRPRLYDDEVYDNELIAQDAAAAARKFIAATGRRERYTVHALDDEARWDSEGTEAEGDFRLIHRTAQAPWR